MRRLPHATIGFLAAALTAGLAGLPEGVSIVHEDEPTPEPTPKPSRQRRHGGPYMPHQGSREMERRRRQMAKVALNAALSSPVPADRSEEEKK